MKPTVQALRAITALYAQGILKFLLLIIGGLLIVLYALVIVFTTQFSIWWLLLLLILVPVTVITITITIILWLGTKRLLPRQLTKQERDEITQFTDRINGLVERARTPYPIALVLVAKDVIRGKESTFLRRLINDSGSIKSDFAAVKRIFEVKK